MGMHCMTVFKVNRHYYYVAPFPPRQVAVATIPHGVVPARCNTINEQEQVEFEDSHLEEPSITCSKTACIYHYLQLQDAYAMALMHGATVVSHVQKTYFHILHAYNSVHHQWK